MRSINSTAIHFSLGLYNCIQFFSNSFNCLWFAFYKNISCFCTWSWRCSNLNFKCSWFFSNVFDCFAFLSNNQSYTFIWDLKNICIFWRWSIRSRQWQIIVSFSLSNSLLILNQLFLFELVKCVVIWENDSFNFSTSFYYLLLVIS